MILTSRHTAATSNLDNIFNSSQYKATNSKVYDLLRLVLVNSWSSTRRRVQVSGTESTQISRADRPNIYIGNVRSLAALTRFHSSLRRIGAL